MRRLAAVGFGSAESTTHYSRLIAEEIRHRFGHRHQPNLITLTVPTADIALAESLRSVRALGAEAVILCSNFTCSSATEVILPELSVYSPITRALRASALRRVGLIGAREASEEKRWQAELCAAGIPDVLLPVPSDRRYLMEMCEQVFSGGLVTEAVRADVVRIVHSLKQAGARALVVIRPEFAEVLHDSVPVLPVFDVCEHHALAAVDWMSDSSDSLGPSKS
jgi:aspartate racemase